MGHLKAHHLDSLTPKIGSRLQAQQQARSQEPRLLPGFAAHQPQGLGHQCPVGFLSAKQG